jgi:hypothetical protein
MEHIEVVATNGEEFDIYFEPEGDYYEIYDALGNCLNEGNLFFEKPTIEQIKELIE